MLSDTAILILFGILAVDLVAVLVCLALAITSGRQSDAADRLAEAIFGREPPDRP